MTDMFQMDEARKAKQLLVIKMIPKHVPGFCTEVMERRDRSEASVDDERYEKFMKTKAKDDERNVMEFYCRKNLR